jgi:Zinc finger, C2H2 type
MFQLLTIMFWLMVCQGAISLKNMSSSTFPLAIPFDKASAILTIADAPFDSILSSEGESLKYPLVACHIREPRDQTWPLTMEVPHMLLAPSGIPMATNFQSDLAFSYTSSRDLANCQGEPDASCLTELEFVQNLGVGPFNPLPMPPSMNLCLWPGCKSFQNDFLTSHDLDFHVQTYHMRQCPWPTCNIQRPFRRRSDLIRHMESVHSGIRHFICDFPGCYKTYSRSDKLTAHKRSHVGWRERVSLLSPAVTTESQSAPSGKIIRRGSPASVEDGAG